MAVPGLPPRKRGTLKGLEKEKDENMVKSNRSGAYMDVSLL